MNSYLLLILLSSWAHVVPLSLQCETGVAYPNHVLSIPRSLMANADVAVLKTYQAETVDKCITDCCIEKYGSCSVASFRKINDTEGDCQHFNCRPVNKCKFLSSNSTDSFSFSSSSSPHILVPSSHASKNDSLSSTIATVTTNKPNLGKSAQNEQGGVKKETVTTYNVEQFAFKNDNTTVKPRKGVDDITEDPFENVTRSGVKPRKGVSLDGVTFSDNTKSKVKPRKGVGPYQSHFVPPTTVTVEPSAHHAVATVKSDHTNASSSATKTYKDIVADDVVSALEKVFEDDTKVKDTGASVAPSTETAVKSTETTSTYVHSFIPTTASSAHTTSVEKTSSFLQSSLATNYVASSSLQTPHLVTPFIQTTETASHTPTPSSSSPTILEHSKVLFREFIADNDVKPGESEETESSMDSENERKYKSSMHLVLSLVFGLLVLFSVLGVVAKRVYDSWMRRHYRRMDFLIDGMYNGYG